MSKEDLLYYMWSKGILHTSDYLQFLETKQLEILQNDTEQI